MFGTPSDAEAQSAVWALIDCHRADVITVVSSCNHQRLKNPQFALCCWSNNCPSACLKLTISRGVNKNDPAHWGGRPATVTLFLQHIARGAVGPPRLAASLQLGVPTSICHLPPVRGERGVRHIDRPSGIQTGGSLGSVVRMVEKEIQLDALSQLLVLQTVGQDVPSCD